jgi:putative acetyltransferase
MLIRAAVVADARAIRDVTYTAFLHHPHHVAGTLPTEHLIIDRLRAADALTLSLVAQIEGEVRGVLAVSSVLVDGKNVAALGLGPVAVAKSHQGRGIGTALIARCIKEVQRLDARVLVVLGDPRLYGRFGFRANANLTLAGIPPQYFMILPIAGSLPQGVVTYHAAFT